MSRRGRWAILMLAGGAGGLQAGEPTALNPLFPPLFSIDQGSPSVPGVPVLASDVLAAPGPVVAIPAANLGLAFPAMDELDAISFGNTSITGAVTFVLTFSVDRESEGAVPPDPIFVGLGLPFNVQDQANKNQAAGDEYMSLTLFTRFGPLPAPPPAAVPNNLDIRDEGDAGGVDFSLEPGDGIDLPNFITPIDAVDAGGRNWDGPAGVPKLYFSMSSSSPSLNLLPGTFSGADVYVDFNPLGPGGQQLYAPPGVLGLQPADDIAALIVFDNGNGFLDPGVDLILFTLSRESPTLLGPFGPADVLASQGLGVFNLFVPANQLGLKPTDHIDMLDLAPCDDVVACAMDWAIGYLALSCPADCTGDGFVDQADLATVLSCYNIGACCDTNGDGVTDQADLAEVLAVYLTRCP